MINYYCPDFAYGKVVYENLIQMKAIAPYAFYDYNIKYIYGAFGSMIWNGGTCLKDIPNIDFVKSIIEFYEQIQVPLQLTLTNPLLEKEDCYDRYCNKVLEIANNGLNEVLVTSPYLEEHIRNKFPNIKINKSIISTEKDEDYLSLLNKYNKIVLPRRKVKDFDFLNTIPFNQKEKFELLCNDPCPLNCPRLYDHYNEYALGTLYEKSTTDLSLSCLTLKNSIFARHAYKKDQISYEEIKENYEPLGFSEFKIAGRSNPFIVIFNVVPYFVKPEYQLDVCSILVKEVIG